jgi:hypothetical protein
MNPHDKENLDFLLNTDSNSLKQWFASVSADDVVYAMELLLAAEIEMGLAKMELDDDPEDLTLANAVLSKFRL